MGPYYELGKVLGIEANPQAVPVLQGQDLKGFKMVRIWVQSRSQEYKSTVK